LADRGVPREPDKFFSIVVCMNVKTDLCGGPYGVICDDGRWDNGMSSLSPCMLGQEMGHGHGLNHSRLDDGTCRVGKGRVVTEYDFFHD
jgi:hypothetical protein